MFHRVLVALLEAEEAFFRPAVAIDPRMIVIIHIRGDEVRRMRIRAGQQDGVDTAHVSREARRVQRADEGLGRHQHLAAEMAALLLRSELILEMDARGTRLDHALHQFEGIERPAEAGFRIRDDRRHVMDRLVAFHMGDLVGAAQRVVDAAHHIRHRRGRVERLVRYIWPALLASAATCQPER